MDLFNTDYGDTDNVYYCMFTHSDVDDSDLMFCVNVRVVNISLRVRTIFSR